MLKQFAQKIEETRRLIDDSRSASFLLAVSGGMDSMCMLDLFSKTLSSSEYAVAHCNFSLRGQESDGDQALVEARASELGVRLFVKRFDTVSYAREHGVSIEMAARELRYAWFEELCHEHGFDVLAVAHNANDNAETLMLNLLRGTGLNGLHGMAEVTDFSAQDSLLGDGEDVPPPARGREQLSKWSCGPLQRTAGAGVIGITSRLSYGQSRLLFRPLLEFTRKQIEGYVLTNRVPYRHDSSNFESDYKRNRIRNEVFPIFAQINPSFVRTLNREIGYFTEAGSIVDEWCRTQLPNVLVPSMEEGHSLDVVISTAKLLATSHWRYLLYYILEQYSFNSQTIASVEDLLTSGRTVSGKRFESPTHMLLTTRDTLMVQLLDKCTHSDEIMVVRGAGIYNFNGVRFSVEVLDRTPDMPLKQPAGTLILDAESLQFPFVCRRWRQGDGLVPLGMRGKKKISDLFADLKFNALQKEASVLLVDTRTPSIDDSLTHPLEDCPAEQQHIAALLGHRIDDRYKVTASTRTILRIIIL